MFYPCSCVSQSFFLAEEKKHLEYMNSLKVYEDQKETGEEKKEEEEKNKDTHKDLFPEDEEEQQQDNSPSKIVG